MTSIQQCTCTHPEQDKLHGNQNRVHNLSPDGKKAYCTVCSPSNRRNKATLTRPNRNAKVSNSN